jgi:hypothetical protein
MIYRRDLLAHFDWLAGSDYLDEVLDEAVLAIALTAHGHGEEWVADGAAWMTADGLVERHRLEGFVERARSQLLFPPADGRR